MSKKEGNAVINYFTESFQELRQVTWPTKDVAVKSTLIVIFVCIGVAIYTGVLDGVFNWGYTLLLSLT